VNKYRQSDLHSSGFNYTTAKKLDQMRFAAEVWVSENDSCGDCALTATEVRGDDYAVSQFLSEL